MSHSKLELQADFSLQTALTPAAVLIPLVVDQNSLSLLFTKRTEEVRHHKGQICFPGGAKDEADSNLWHTALRETHEEIGITNSHILLLGELPELITPTGFHVTPYIGFIHSLENLSPNPSEICAVFTVPLSHLLNKDNLRFEEREYFGSVRQTPFFTYEQHVIWGATGRMTLSLIELMQSQQTHKEWSEKLPQQVLELF